eukprot:m.92418 g.92418  ORF g.92418 m.92418 type:complete len:1299 (-) comp21718_c0_seq1:367-4263(-)
MDENGTHAVGSTFTVKLNKRGKGFGFMIAGGDDNTPVKIDKIFKDGAALAGGLLVGDIIRSVDGEPMTSHNQAVEALRNSALDVELVVERPPAGDSSTDTAPMSPPSTTELPISSEQTPPPSTEPKLEEDPMAHDFEIMQGGFGTRLSALVELIAERGVNGIERLNKKFGGVSGLSARLNTNTDRGISATQQDIENRQRVFGANIIPEVKPKSFFQLMWEALQDVTLVILIIAGIISLILGLTVEEDSDTAWIEGAAIMISVVIVVFVTALNDLQKERQFQALKKCQDSQKTVKAMRNGELAPILVDDILVGDILHIGTGDVIPADGIVISSSDLACDESALTGESDVVKKSVEKNPFLMSGTFVKNGSGKMIVTCVGLFSEEGVIQRLITGIGAEETLRLEALDRDMAGEVEDFDDQGHEAMKKMSEKEIEERLKDNEKKKAKKESVLQVKLTRMAIQIGYCGTVAALLTVVVLILRYCIEEFGVDNEPYSGGIWSDLLSFVIVAVTVLVVAVPEGLPLAVTISLAYSVKKMMKDNNLVRILAACETMGNATTICSDKTGTLTQNRMSVVRSYLDGKDITDVNEVKKLPESLRFKFVQHAALNSDVVNSNYYYKEGDDLPVQEGNKTECAILQFADQISDKTYKQLRQEVPRDQYVKYYPFSSAKKRMGCVIQLETGKYRLYLKGASEIVLGLSSFIELSDGIEDLDASAKEKLENEVINFYASKALRVLLLCYRDFDSAQDWENEDELMQNLTVTGFVGIQDPVRPEVPTAIATCQQAGVTVRMVTGDNLVTARAIAKNCGIIPNVPDDELDPNSVMEGPEFRRQILKEDGEIDYEILDTIWPSLRVVARCSPSDKYNLVKGLIHAQQVVAVTGDGTNDGPALSEADVGFAMGIAGTAVAKEASDIIIMDDNFTSIVKAVSWGRNVYDSISKFLVFQLTVNVVAVSVAFIGACALKESPLRAVQLLWVNLIMDTFAALALATEPPSPSLLTRKPYGRHQSLISRTMFRQILGHSIYQVVVVLFLVWYADEMFDIKNGRGRDHNDPPTQHYTIVFNTFVWLQIFNEINARKIHDELNVFHNFFNNPIFTVILIGTMVVQALITEYGGRAFKVTGLDWEHWLVCIAFGLGSLIWNVVLHYAFPVAIIPEAWFAPKEPTQEERIKALEEESSDPTNIVTPGSRLPASRASGLLWVRGMQRLRTQLRVIGAFRDAGHALRRRSSLLGTRSIRGPMTDDNRPVNWRAVNLWRRAGRQLRFQLQVARAFNAGVVRSSIEDSTEPADVSIQLDPSYRPKETAV